MFAIGMILLKVPKLLGSGEDEISYNKKLKKNLML